MIKPLTEEELRALWDVPDEDGPHFGGQGPHRYEYDRKAAQKTCVYCGRPASLQRAFSLSEFGDRLVGRMQAPDARRAARDALHATSKELGDAAVAAAAKRSKR